MNKVLISITYKYETQIPFYVKKVSNLDEVYEILSNYWKEEDVISKAFYTAYEMLNGKLEGEEAYFNVVDGFHIKVSTIK
jgi:hypothetical protein